MSLTLPLSFTPHRKASDHMHKLNAFTEITLIDPVWGVEAWRASLNGLPYHIEAMDPFQWRGETKLSNVLNLLAFWEGQAIDTLAY